jgi:hypothetical protein
LIVFNNDTTDVIIASGARQKNVRQKNILSHIFLSGWSGVAETAPTAGHDYCVSIVMHFPIVPIKLGIVTQRVVPDP